jgi:hypothetical protein
MLTNTPHRHYSSDEDIDFIHNYYERRVLQEIFTTNPRAQQDREFLADVACVALNRLPPRYIRHDVDMTFFMSPQEMQEIEDKVTHAVKAALIYVASRERNDVVAPTSSTTDTKKAVKKPVVKKVKKSS